jgi:hypothetical protein
VHDGRPSVSLRCEAIFSPFTKGYESHTLNLILSRRKPHHPLSLLCAGAFLETWASPPASPPFHLSKYVAHGAHLIHKELDDIIPNLEHDAIPATNGPSLLLGRGFKPVFEPDRIAHFGKKGRPLLKVRMLLRQLED